MMMIKSDWSMAQRSIVQCSTVQYGASSLLSLSFIQTLRKVNHKLLTLLQKNMR